MLADCPLWLKQSLALLALCFRQKGNPPQLGTSLLQVYRWPSRRMYSRWAVRWYHPDYPMPFSCPVFPMLSQYRMKPWRAEIQIPMIPQIIL